MKIEVTAQEPIDMLVNDTKKVDVTVKGITPVAKIDVTVRGFAKGEKGDQGDPGSQGPIGATGASGGTYFHSQSLPSAVWTITHSLGYNPGGITVTDSSGRNVEGQVDYINSNSLTITFTAAFSGSAYLS